MKAEPTNKQQDTRQVSELVTVKKIVSEFLRMNPQYDGPLPTTEGGEG